MIRRPRRIVAPLAALAVAALAASSEPVSAQENHDAKGATPSPGLESSQAAAEPDPEEEDRVCATGVRALAAELQKQGDKGAAQAGAGVVGAYQRMRAACDDYRDCKVDCRQDKRSCKAGAKSEKHACLAECAKKSGKERRTCRRSCRRDKREDVRECRDDKRSCKEECKDELLDDECAKGRSGFFAAVGRAQQASKAPKGTKGPDPTALCAPLYAN